MSIFSFIKHMFSGRGTKYVCASFDQAQTNKDNVRHWASQDCLTPDAEANPETRRTLRCRQRYEITNNSYARGLVHTIANDTIGTGQRIQVDSPDDRFSEQVESAWSDWATKIRLTEKLRLMRIARCQDGESFAVIQYNPKIADNVKLDLNVIEADRVKDETVNLNDDYIVDGIRFDRYGNAVSYKVLKQVPNPDAVNVVEEYNTISANDMIHIYMQTRPGLHRGIPEITAQLPLFAQLRRYNLAVLSQAESAADFAAILYTDAPPDGESAYVDPFESIDLERNMMTSIPAGWKMGQLDPKQPTANHSDFVKIILSEIARCVCGTYGNISGDYSGYNYSSGRLDNQIYQKSIIVDRKLWESVVLNRLFDAWYREYCLMNNIRSPRSEIRVQWFWDGFYHVDPNREANAQAVRIRNNTTSLAEECAKDGRDYVSVLRQRAKEIRMMKELGIPLDDNVIQVQESEQDKEEKKE